MNFSRNFDSRDDVITVPTVQVEEVEACNLIKEAIELRQKYTSNSVGHPPEDIPDCEQVYFYLFSFDYLFANFLYFDKKTVFILRHSRNKKTYQKIHFYTTLNHWR